MSSAKVTIKVQDRSAIIPSLPGIYAGITIASNKGDVGKAVLVTSTNDLIDRFGEPDPALGVAMYSALTYLAQGNKLWVTRALHEDARYAAATVRWKIDPLATNFPEYTYEPDRIVRPLPLGLSQSELDSYAFEVSATSRVYEDTTSDVLADSNTDLVRVDTFGELASGDQIVISSSVLGALTQVEETFTIEENVTIVAQYDNLTVAAPVTQANEGDVIEKVEAGPTYTAYTGNPVIGKASTNSSTLFALNADYIQPGDTIRIGGAGGQEVVFNEKNLYTEDNFFFKLDKPATVTAGQFIYDMVEDEFEDRDAFLVYGVNPSVDFNKVSTAVTPSSNYDNAFNLVVYFEGVQVETWEVTREDFKDGYQRQLNMEDKINGNSKYIGVRNNPNAVDSDGEPAMPLNTDHSIWRQNSDDVFVATTLSNSENILKGHTQVQFPTDPAAVTGIVPGARIKFVTGDDQDNNLTLSAEYKIVSIDSVNNFLILDRELVEDQISMQWVDNAGTSINTLMYFFDATNQDAPTGLVDGVQRYNPQTVPNTYYNYPLNAPFTISGNAGVLLDAGANLLLGGSLGSAVTISDINNGYDLMSNKEATPVTLLMDGGWTFPAVAQKILAVCQKQGLTHGYVSVDPNAERASDYKAAIVEYRNSTQLNSELISIFSGWVKIQDDYNQKEIFIAPDGFAAASQSFTTRNYNIFTPAAGWIRGKLTGGLGLLQVFDEGDRDFLVENRINPIRSKEGSGLVIWGNETTLTRPSPLQIRSVSMLIIAIKFGLEAGLEAKTFELNNNRTHTQTEGALRGFMRDEIKAKGGVVDFQVSVTDVITPADFDNRKMPIFIGVKPTTDIKEIGVTLAIFNNSVDIVTVL